MARQPLVARRAEEMLGTAVVATAPVAGGDIARATKLRLSDGSTAIMKTLPLAPSGFFETEAQGLRWLAEAGLRTPELLASGPDALILRWVEPGRPSPDAAEELGRALAAAHGFGVEPAGGFGWDHDGFIGSLPMPNQPAPTWAEFYAVRRVLPYLKLARDRRAIEEDDAAVIERLVGRLPTLVPEEPPARLHGDLWNGNVLWAHDGHAWLIDPAAYAGHRETDLAMLTLFGLPHLEKLVAAYQSVRPLAEGWEDRVGIHQLFPLLVHACLFGGGYGLRAAEIARRFT